MAACAGVTPGISTDALSEDLEARTGHGLAPEPTSIEGLAERLPETVALDDGLSEDEAVAIALWNNPSFLSAASELGIARADLAQAGLLGNPVLSLLFANGPRQLEAALKWPLDGLWQRPKRLAAARANSEAVAARLVESGLQTAREAKVALADLVLARQLEDASAVSVEKAAEIARLMDVRLRLGDVGALEAGEARRAALAIEQQALLAQGAARLAEERLLGVLGLGEGALRFRPEPAVADAPEIFPEEPEELVKQALAARPDVRAAEVEIEAAGKRLGLARADWLRLTAVIDAKDQIDGGFDVAPGLDFELPLFDRGQARRARARAELERAGMRYRVVRNRVALEVREARLSWSSAEQALRRHQQEVGPAFEAAERQTRAALERGDVARLEVLRAELATLGASSQEAQLVHQQAVARARLEAAVGMNLKPMEAKR